MKHSTHQHLPVASGKLIQEHKAKYHDAYAVKFTLELMASGEYERALESAQLRLSQPCWITSQDIGMA
jgi:hypothetical protein